MTFHLSLNHFLAVISFVNNSMHLTHLMPSVSQIYSPEENGNYFKALYISTRWCQQSRLVLYIKLKEETTITGLIKWSIFNCKQLFLVSKQCKYLKKTTQLYHHYCIIFKHMSVVCTVYYEIKVIWWNTQFIN